MTLRKQIKRNELREFFIAMVFATVAMIILGTILLTIGG